jgi:6-phosphogluconolactonase (cycloisomerase 2 family)
LLPLSTMRRRPRRSSIRAIALLVVLGAAALGLAGPAAASPALTGRHMYGYATVGSGQEILPFDVAQDGSLVERDDQAFPLAAGSTYGAIVVGRDARTVYVGVGDWFDFNTFQMMTGEIDVLSVAADGSLSLAQTVPGGITHLAIAPDGSRLFAILGASESVVSFPIEGDGTLGTASTPTTPGFGGALSLTLSPVGPTLYVGTFNDPIYQYSIGADGTLTALSPATVSFPCQATYTDVTPGSTTLDGFCDNTQNGYSYPIGADGALGASPSSVTATQGEYAATADVRGRALYTSISPNDIEQWQRQSDGSLAPFTAGTAPSGQTQWLATDPSGDTLVADEEYTLSRYAIASDGSLSSSPVDLTTTAEWVLDMVYSPDQPPVAAVADTTSGLTAAFDAGASHAVDGTIASYDWSFGDGTTLVNGGATPSHTYVHAGDYTATVTLTDSIGCSVAGTFSGLDSICAGSPTARATTTVHVTEPSAAAPATADPTTTTVDPPAPVVTPPSPSRLLAAPKLAGSKVLLSWHSTAGAPTATRYLVLWSVVHSARGATDRKVKHRTWTTSTTLKVPHTTARTIHFAVYAYGSDGTMLRSAKTTIHLER